MKSRLLVALCGAAATMGCTTLALPPTQVIRYHQDGDIRRGPIAVKPAAGSTEASAIGAPSTLEYQVYGDAVRAALLRNGYSDAASGTAPELTAEVAFSRTSRQGPPRSSPVSIGLGGGGFSGGGWRGGSSVGGGLGVGFPIGGTRPSELTVTEMRVTIKQADGTPIWEGNAQTIGDARREGADAGVQAQKLADAMFTGFPGESGRTIEVK